MTGKLACRMWLAVSCAVAVTLLAGSDGALATPLGSISEYPVSALADAIDGGRAEIAAGPDGNMWFTAGSSIGEISPWTHQVADYYVGYYALPYGIVAGPDGNIWFTDLGTVRSIGEINPTTHAITQYPILDGTEPGGITPGPDGNLWFTLAASIAEINPSTHQIAEYPAAGATDIAAGSGGALWFTDGGSIGEINAFTHDILHYPTPTIPGVDGGPLLQAITEGPDGNMWFTATWNWFPAGGNPQVVGEIRPKTHRITEFRVPHARAVIGNYPEDVPFGIAAGPDGNVWFADGGTNPSIGVVGPALDKAVLSDLSMSPDGTVHMRLAAAISGRIDVLETAWRDNLAPSATAAATDLEPAPGRFVVARTSTRVASGGTVSLTIPPNTLGDRLIRRHRYRVTLRLWVVYAPAVGRTDTVGLYGLHVGGKCPAVTSRGGRMKATCA